MSFKLLFVIIFSSAALAALLLGYRLFVASPAIPANDSSGIVTEAGVGTAATPEDIEYTRLLKVISGIQALDRSIFTDPVFRSLFLFNFPIPTPVPNRANPFAPIGLP